MRVISFIVFIFALSFFVSAQTPAKIKMGKSGLGKIAVTRGKMRSVIDLSKTVAGCAYISGAAKQRLDKIGCAAPPARFELIDATEKNKRTYLILAAETQENCNVCGQCGASEATTLIWLKLDASLRVLEQKDIRLSFCMESISMISPVSAEDDETFKLPVKNNVMTVEFEKSIYGENDAESFEFTRVEYDRTKPEKGFVIKTEKRGKSSVSER